MIINVNPRKALSVGSGRHKLLDKEEALRGAVGETPRPSVGGRMDTYPKGGAGCSGVGD